MCDVPRDEHLWACFNNVLIPTSLSNICKCSVHEMEKTANFLQWKQMEQAKRKGKHYIGMLQRKSCSYLMLGKHCIGMLQRKSCSFLMLEVATESLDLIERNKDMKVSIQGELLGHRFPASEMDLQMFANLRCPSLPFLGPLYHHRQIKWEPLANSQAPVAFGYWDVQNSHP